MDFELKYIASSSMVTAAMLSGEAEVGLVGSVGIVQAVTKGVTGGVVDAATLSPPMDARALSQGFHHVVYGPDLKIPYLAAAFDRDFALKVVAKQLRLEDRKILETAYASEIGALEPRLEIKREGLEAVLDEVAQTDPRAKGVKPEALVDRRYLDDMERTGFFDKLWGK